MCRSSANILLPTILLFRIQRCNSFPLQPRSHTGPLISSFGCFSKFPRIPILSYTPNRALFSSQRSTTLGGGRVSLTRVSSGTPCEKLLKLAKGVRPHRLLLATQGRLPAITLAPVHLSGAANRPEKPSVVSKQRTRSRGGVGWGRVGGCLTRGGR